MVREPEFRAIKSAAMVRKVTRYSQLYIERGRPQDDSERARVRLQALLVVLLPRNRFDGLQSILALELGARRYIGEFFSKCETRHLLDGITVIYSYIKNDNEFTSRRPGEDYDLYEIWRLEVSRILREENLAYRLDEDAMVHPYVDPEFEINRTSALEALLDPKFGEARTDFEAAYRHLRGREYKQAMRMMFPAVEVAAKVLFPNKFSNLGPGEVDRHIAPKMRARYAGN